MARKPRTTVAKETKDVVPGVDGEVKGEEYRPRRGGVVSILDAQASGKTVFRDKRKEGVSADEDCGC